MPVKEQATLSVIPNRKYSERLKDYKLSDKQIKKYKKLVARVKKDIPEIYNQIDLVDFLIDPNIDHLISISNRADGKSFNYVHFLVIFALECDIKFLMVGRHFTVRNALASLITKIFDTFKDLKLSELQIRNTDDYKYCIYENKIFCVISDLNNASDLKLHSSFVSDFPIIVYDEFLALSSDYIPQEVERLELVFSTIDRKGFIPYICMPKILYLGNAVNFESPILAKLNLFNKLENQEINSLCVYENKVMEIVRNDKVNEIKNSRAFDSDDNSNTTTEFDFNNHFIVTDSQRKHILYDSISFNIRLDDKNICVTHSPNNLTLLSVETITKNYDFCVKISDIKDNVTYLNEKFFKEKFSINYEKGMFLFENAFSKSYIVNNALISTIRIDKCITIFQEKNKELPVNKNERKYIENKLNRSLDSIYNKFWK